MKTYTLEDLRTFPVINGILQCPSGNYTAIDQFPSHCSFGEGCGFGARCSFGAQCGFGARCGFGEWCVFGECCSFGARCGFGEGCRFGARCIFGARCSFGARCGFGARCVFSEGCSFGECCSFGEDYSFGAGCSFEGYKAHPGYPLLTFGGAGSINRTVYAYNVEGGPLIRAGCFVGTLEEFRAKVRKDGDEMKSIQYLGFANIVAATWCPERVEK